MSRHPQLYSDAPPLARITRASDSILMRNFASMFALPILASLVAAGQAAPLKPSEHGDFEHYTFALTWQPGFCSTEKGCLADQPKNVLIGLHGLWASRPKSLIDQGVPREKWWQNGCDYFHQSDEVPALSPTLDRQLADVMPHLHDDLLIHEYDKHVQCFGLEPSVFFEKELAMRKSVVESGFGAYLTSRIGSSVTRKAVVEAFGTAFRTSAPRAVQLRCDADRSGRTVLTQFWTTIRAGEIDRFPDGASLEDAPVVQDNCPETFFIPTW